MRVLGIDPGLAKCGVAVLENGDVHAMDVIRTKTGTPLAQRVQNLSQLLRPFFWGSDVVVIESPNFPPGRVAAAQVWAAFGVLMGIAAGPLRVFSAQRWRKMLALGHIGGATELARRERKRTTRLAMEGRYGADRIAGCLRPHANGLHEHAIDALAIATAWWISDEQLP